MKGKSVCHGVQGIHQPLLAGVLLMWVAVVVSATVAATSAQEEAQWDDVLLFWDLEEEEMEGDGPVSAPADTTEVVVGNEEEALWECNSKEQAGGDEEEGEMEGILFSLSKPSESSGTRKATRRERARKRHPDRTRNGRIRRKPSALDERADELKSKLFKGSEV